MFATAFVFGLLASFHCIGMCGPIALVLPIHHFNKREKIVKITLYHIGRMLAYGSMGLLFGLLGKGLFLSGFQQRLSLLVGLIMIRYVLIPSKYLKKNNSTAFIYKILQKLKSKLGNQLKKKSNKALLGIGFLNGFLPCGMVYMALVGALATSNPLNGAVYMSIYGLGTVPLMTVLFYSKNIFSISFRNKIQKAIPVFVVLIGLLFIVRGLGVGIPYISPNDASLQINTEGKYCAPN